MISAIFATAAIVAAAAAIIAAMTWTVMTSQILGCPVVGFRLVIAPQFHPSAIRWLAERDQKKESSEEDFRRSQLREARAAKIAAIVAAIAAIVAVIISATSKIAAMLR